MNSTEADLQYWYKEAERRLDELNALRIELTATENLAIKQGEWLQSIVNITKGEPGELAQHSTHDVVESVEALRVERDGLAARVSRLRSALKICDQVMCNGSRIISYSQQAIAQNEARAILAESPDQSIAHIKAQGAREALQRAMQTPGFSGTVVRVDALQAVIEQMEGELWNG